MKRISHSYLVENFSFVVVFPYPSQIIHPADGPAGTAAGFAFEEKVFDASAVTPGTLAGFFGHQYAALSATDGTTVPREETVFAPAPAPGATTDPVGHFLLVIDDLVGSRNWRAIHNHRQQHHNE
jgi:hypothetical protein